MEQGHSFIHLADKICALFCSGTETSDREMADVIASLTPEETNGLRDEMGRRAEYDRLHPERHSLFYFPAFLEKVLHRT